MSLVSLDTLKYVSKPIIGGSLIYLYDVFYTGLPYQSKFCLYDFGVMAGSVFVSNLSKDLIAELFHLNSESIQYKVIEPVLNVIIYMYAFDFVMKKNYDNRQMRSVNLNVILPILSTMIASYMENPISAFVLGIKNF